MDNTGGYGRMVVGFILGLMVLFAGTFYWFMYAVYSTGIRVW